MASLPNGLRVAAFLYFVLEAQPSFRYASLGYDG